MSTAEDFAPERGSFNQQSRSRMHTSNVLTELIVMKS